MPCRTSALMMALSMLVIYSKRASPRTIRIADGISISGYPMQFGTARYRKRIRGKVSIVKPKGSFSPPRNGAPFAGKPNKAN
jgi:hypothetical protein